MTSVGKAGRGVLEHFQLGRTTQQLGWVLKDAEEFKRQHTSAKKRRRQACEALDCALTFPPHKRGPSTPEPVGRLHGFSEKHWAWRNPPPRTAGSLLSGCTPSTPHPREAGPSESPPHAVGAPQVTQPSTLPPPPPVAASSRVTRVTSEVASSPETLVLVPSVLASVLVWILYDFVPFLAGRAGPGAPSCSQQSSLEPFLGALFCYKPSCLFWTLSLRRKFALLDSSVNGARAWIGAVTNGDPAMGITSHLHLHTLHIA
ncbi:hypothetical protein TREES_T100013366 [Tupaia chinensis]|uniref:Uncharacterized protein n=1 Tax=Tupaia chinensis TaxID=246437 RepID=L9KAR5_TUPCH|nr:hypothetical protein TREES_T100013366 [Tupaia chinensis]